MVAQAGRAVLLKISDGEASPTFVTLAGLRAKTISLNAQTIDATSAESLDGWRELMPGGVKSASVSGSGVFRDQAADALARAVFFAQSVRAWQLIIPDFATLEGPFILAALEYSGRHDGEAQYALTLASAGALSVTSL